MIDTIFTMVLSNCIVWKMSMLINAGLHSDKRPDTYYTQCFMNVPILYSFGPTQPKFFTQDSVSSAVLRLHKANYCLLKVLTWSCYSASVRSELLSTSQERCSCCSLNPRPPRPSYILKPRRCMLMSKY